MGMNALKKITKKQFGEEKERWKKKNILHLLVAKCYVCMQPGVFSVLLSGVYRGSCF